MSSAGDVVLDDSHRLLRVLRRRADEVQFNQALAAICQFHGVAHQVCRVLLEAVALGGSTQAERLLRKMPPEVSCADQVRYEGIVGRGRRAVRSKGSSDLMFSGHEFQLLAELKINHEFDSAQAERYLSSNLPVLVVARNPERVEKIAPRRDPWLGAIGWEDVLDGLRGLSPPSEAGRQWMGLLDVMEYDGDFRQVRPSSTPELERVAKWLNDKRAELGDLIKREISRSQPNGSGRREFAESISARKAGANWYSTNLDFRVPPDLERPISIRVRWSRSGAPSVQVVWKRPRTPRGKKQALEDGHRRLERAEFTANTKQTVYRRAVPVPRGKTLEERLDLAAPELERALVKLARSGVLAADVRRNRKAKKH